MTLDFGQFATAPTPRAAIERLITVLAGDPAYCALVTPRVYGENLFIEKIAKDLACDPDFAPPPLRRTSDGRYQLVDVLEFLAGFHCVRERRDDPAFLYPVTGVEFIAGDRDPRDAEIRLYLNGLGLASELLELRNFSYFVSPERAEEISTTTSVPEWYRHPPAERELVSQRIMLSGSVVCDLYRAVATRNSSARDLAACAAEGHV